jgi:hypothetical protein
LSLADRFCIEIGRGIDLSKLKGEISVAKLYHTQLERLAIGLYKALNEAEIVVTVEFLLSSKQKLLKHLWLFSIGEGINELGV